MLELVWWTTLLKLSEFTETVSKNNFSVVAMFNIDFAVLIQKYLIADSVRVKKKG